MRSVPTAVLVAAAAVLVIMGIVLIATTSRSGRDPSGTPSVSAATPTVRAPSPTTPATTPPVRGSARTAPPEPEGNPSPDERAPSKKEVQRGLEATWPSDLPSAQRRDLVDLGWQVVRADLTGAGRDRWPEYFPGGPPRYGYSEVRKLAGTAVRAGERTDRVSVILVWEGEDMRGTEVPQQQTTQCLGRDGPGWRPLVSSGCAQGRETGRA